VRRPLAGGAPVPVRFRVTGRGGGPVAGAAVTLLNGQGATVTSAVADAAGGGRLVAPHPDAYVLVASAPGHQPGAIAVGADPGPVGIELVLARSASVAGVVRVDGEIVPNAQLTLVQDGEVVELVVTDAAGRFRITELSGGEYALAVTAEACPPAVVVLEVPEEEDLTYDVDLAGP
jgi:Carboxypeptidase regulatory-like domain